MRVRPLVTVMLALLLAAVATPVGAQEAESEVVVRVAIHADEQNLNPFVAPQAQPLTHDLTMLVYDTLFWSQSRLNPDPWLATGAEPSEDLRTWTVTLREGVLWHDGEPFTADDVAFTYQYFKDIGGPGRYGRHVYLHPVLESATVIDDTTVELAFAQPVATFMLIPGGDLPILPQHLWEGVADPRADTTTLPIGTGPYRMVDHQPGASYRLEANEGYFLGAPIVDTLELSIIPDDEAAFAALAAGEIDMVARNVPTGLDEEIERDESLDIVGSSRNQTVYLQFDVARPGLDDRKVRKALSLAVDSDALLNEVEGGNGRLGTDTWTHPNSPWTRDPEASHLADLIASNQLLDSAGYNPDGNGVRLGPDGQALAYTLGVDTTRPRHTRAAELLVAQFAEVGVALTIEGIDTTAAAAARGSGVGPVPDVDILLDEVESHAQDDPDHLYFLFHSGGGGVGDVFGNYANPDLDAVVERALGQPEAPRRGLIHDAQDIIAEDIPAIALYFPAGRIAYRPDAYDGWWSDEGHGILTKRAFLPGSADPGTDGRDDIDASLTPVSIPAYEDYDDTVSGGDGGGSRTVGIALVSLGVLAAGGAAGFAFLRRRGTIEGLVD